MPKLENHFGAFVDISGFDFLTASNAQIFCKEVFLLLLAWNDLKISKQNNKCAREQTFPDGTRNFQGNTKYAQGKKLCQENKKCSNGTRNLREPVKFQAK